MLCLSLIKSQNTTARELLITASSDISLIWKAIIWKKFSVKEKNYGA